MTNDSTMQSCQFEAHCVALQHPDGDCHLVGFADHELQTRVYLMLQRAIEPDEQDIRLGMDTYHLEWCSQDRSGYGGIARFVLRPAAAEITFTPDAAAGLDGMQQLCITFQLPPEHFARLGETLGQIFQGTDCLFAVNT